MADVMLRSAHLRESEHATSVAAGPLRSRIGAYRDHRRHSPEGAHRSRTSVSNIVS